jgi:site-specific recombinase XerC
MPAELQPVREMVDVTPRHDPITLKRALSDWKNRHGPWRDADAEKKATKAKTTAAELLFASAGTSDMAAITTQMIQTWKDDLEGRQAHDLVAHVKGLYTALAANNRPAAGNPADKIETPRKPEHKPRAEFSDERATLILRSALASDDPLIKWGPMVMAFTGMIVSEFVYAPTSEIKQIDGVWCWELGENRILKTGNRPRVIPLHAALLRPGFLDYVRSRGHGLLFGIDNTRASAALMDHLRSLGIKGADQVNYSWRHRFISQLVANKVDPTLRRYLEGHGALGVDEKFYIHHHLPEMVEAISGLKDSI